MTIIYILLALIMFGIMITIHEAGHFFAARIAHIPVKEFAIGFGPPLLSWQSKKHETVFYLRSIPVGGYCMFYGENDIEGKEKEDPRSFGKYPVFSRLMTILMGPLMNFVLALVVAFAFYLSFGIPKNAGPYVTEVHTVNQNSPAELAGIWVGDKIQTINGRSVEENLSAILDQEAEKGHIPMEVGVLRGYGDGQQTIKLSATPLKSPDNGHYLLGVIVNVSAPIAWEKAGPSDAVGAAFTLCRRASTGVLNGFRSLILKGEGFDSMTGVVGVTQMIVEETRRSSLQGYLSMMIFISINLGLVNLFPFPGLDGSRLLFLLVEAVRGKPAKREAYVHTFGMLLLLGFILFITLRDLMRLF